MCRVIHWRRLLETYNFFCREIDDTRSNIFQGKVTLLLIWL
ncbi:hypothetical protein LINGRAHAP2_LOCUS15286 [Linum grandiflorum]